IVRVDRLVLNEETLTNLAVTVGQLRKVSERAVATVDRIDSLIESNTPSVNLAVTNLVAFSDQLSQAAASLQNLVATNKDEVSAAVKNIESATTLLNSLLTDLQAGKGLAGSLLKNERTEREFAMVLGNLNTLSSNLTVTSSNLNAHGIWWMLWKPKPERTSRPSAPSGKPGGH
ncbi:MAG TPA: hypothetical protein VHH73_06830, partial [Verrucomicrobiae bacterium]|nr:hypothetical protein [Verrucomicrobiae bacterium]